MGPLLPLVLSALWVSAPPPNTGAPIDRSGAYDSVRVDPSDALEAAVREAVARRWAITPTDVVLDWGPIGEPWPDTLPGSVDLLGSGVGGYWVLSVPSTDGAERRARIRAGVRTPRAIAAVDLKRNAVLVAGDIALEDQVEWGPPKEREASPTEGWVTRRIIRAGEPLRRPAVTPPAAVHSGDPIQAVWRRSGVEVVLEGIAAGSASAGEKVYVRTPDGHRYRGTVVSPGRVLLESGTPRDR